MFRLQENAEVPVLTHFLLSLVSAVSEARLYLI